MAVNKNMFPINQFGAECSNVRNNIVIGPGSAQSAFSIVNNLNNFSLFDQQDR